MENAIKRIQGEEEDLFGKLGLHVAPGEVEIGKTYPIFGMITKLISDEPGNVICEINNSIRAKMNVNDVEKVNVLKERAFESGIFVSTVVSKSPGVEVDCQVVIFGKKQSFNA